LATGVAGGGQDSACYDLVFGFENTDVVRRFAEKDMLSNEELIICNNQTSFLPNLSDKTTSVAEEIHNPPPDLITSLTGNRRLMRLLGACYLRATEVVLLVKLGGNEVLSPLVQHSELLYSINFSSLRSAGSSCA
jgi:hypothetical protein